MTAPELNKNVVETYRELLSTYLNEDFTLGFVENSDWESTYFGSLTPALSHQYVGSVDKYIEDIQKEVGLGKTIATETIVFNDLPAHGRKQDMGEHTNKFLWLNSPITNLKYATIDEYLTSLKAKRRYKVKHALEQSEALGLEFEYRLVIQDKELRDLHEFVTHNLKLRFCKDTNALKNADYVYALRQWLWFYAAAKHGYGYLQLVYSDDNLVATTFHIMKLINTANPILYFQGIIKDESGFIENIGAICLTKLIAHLLSTRSGRLFSYFDPTCKTSLYASNVDIYKRLVVNTDCVKPMIFACPTLDYVQSEGIAPPYYIGDEDTWYECESVHGEGL